MKIYQAIARRIDDNIARRKRYRKTKKRIYNNKDKYHCDRQKVLL